MLSVSRVLPSLAEASTAQLEMVQPEAGRLDHLNLLGTAVSDCAARAQNPTISTLSLRRRARELGLAAGARSLAKDPYGLWD